MGCGMYLRQLKVGPTLLATRRKIVDRDLVLFLIGVVEHVHINDGGQAVIGTINPRTKPGKES